jgi:hypothetical protein
VRSRALVSVTIAATLGTREPLRGQLRIALQQGRAGTRVPARVLTGATGRSEARR